MTTTARDVISLRKSSSLLLRQPEVTRDMQSEGETIPMALRRIIRTQGIHQSTTQGMSKQYIR